jgi:hypothetical protein
MIQIDVSSRPAQSFRCVLGWRYCLITLRQKGARMYLDLIADDRPIVRGAICQHGADVVQGAEPHFEGSIHFWDFDGFEPPRWGGLGSRWAMVWLPPGESVPERLRW